MSAFGSSGFGSSSFGNSGFGNSGFGGGGGGFGSSGFGSSGFGGNRGFGNSSFGQSGFGNSGFGNSGFGNSGFGGGQYGGGQQFVGRDAADMQNTFQQTNRAQLQFYSNMNRRMARNDRDSTPISQNAAQPIRMEVRVAFQAPRPTSEVVADTLRTRLAKILGDRGMSQPVVTMQGDTAVLRGVAASDSERQVIGQLAALEQGVREVRNEMTVAGETNTTSVQ
jgi:PPE-repeat protein